MCRHWFTAVGWVGRDPGLCQSKVSVLLHQWATAHCSPTLKSTVHSDGMPREQQSFLQKIWHFEMHGIVEAFAQLLRGKKKLPPRYYKDGY